MYVLQDVATFGVKVNASTCALGPDEFVLTKETDVLYAVLSATFETCRIAHDLATPVCGRIVDLGKVLLFASVERCNVARRVETLEVLINERLGLEASR